MDWGTYLGMTGIVLGIFTAILATILYIGVIVIIMTLYNLINPPYDEEDD